MNQPKEIRRDKVVCTRVLYDDGSSQVFLDFEKPADATPLNSESLNFMFTFLRNFIQKWERNIFDIKKAGEEQQDGPGEQ